VRPTEFYALPTETSEPWHQSYGSLGLLFDDDGIDHDVERDAAKEADAGALSFEQKLFDSGDGERTISYGAATFEGRPFAILVRSGRGGEDNQSRHITDLDTFQAAKSYVEKWRTDGSRLRNDVAPPDEDLPILRGTYGHAVMALDGVTRLVDVDHLDDAGRVLFDEKAFRAAFDRLVRPAFPPGDEEFKLGLKSQRMRDVTVPALLEAVPDGMRATDDFDPIPKVEGFTPFLGWSPVLIASDDATYALGPLVASGSHFTWRTGIRAEKVGPPELFDELARGSPPTP
jgi:hypothetical protein